MRTLAGALALEQREKHSLLELVRGQEVHQGHLGR
jgi:hypothetical protein